MVKKTGGDAVIMEKGKQKGYYGRSQGTSMDVKPSTSYESWSSKIISRDDKKKSQNKSPECIDQGS